MSWGFDFRTAWRALWHAKGLALTVIATLALGIGANAAIVSLVRSVLLRPLVNRDEQRIVYIRQSAPASAAKTSPSRCLKFRISESV